MSPTLVSDVLHVSNYLLTFYSLLREKRETDRELFDFCRLRQGAALHSIQSLLALPVSVSYVTLSVSLTALLTAVT